MSVNEITKGIFIDIKRNNPRTEPSGALKLKLQGENEEPTKVSEKQQPMS